MKLFDKIVKHSRAYGIGESLTYANGVPMAHSFRVHWLTYGASLAYLCRVFMAHLWRVDGIPSVPLKGGIVMIDLGRNQV